MNLKFSTSLLILFSFFQSLSAHAASTPAGIRFQGEEYAQDSHMEFTLHESFPASVSFNEVKTVLADPSLKVNFSSFLVAATNVPLNDVRKRYRMVSTGKVSAFGITLKKKIGAICIESETPQSWSQTCDADLSFESTKMVLKKSRVTTTCGLDSESRVECDIHSVVYPNGVNYLVFVRTPEELCFSSTSESLIVMGHLYEYLIHGLNVDAAKQAFKEDRLEAWGDTLTDLWNLSKNDELNGNSVKMNATSASGLTYDLK
jgi:hypothetical protein